MTSITITNMITITIAHNRTNIIITNNIANDVTITIATMIATMTITMRCTICKPFSCVGRALPPHHNAVKTCVWIC